MNSSKSALNLTSVMPSLAAHSILLTTSIPIRPITCQPHTTPLLPQCHQQTYLHFHPVSQCQLMRRRPDMARLPKQSVITTMPTTSACIVEAITLSMFAQTCLTQPRSALFQLSPHLDRLDWQGSLCPIPWNIPFVFMSLHLWYFSHLSVLNYRSPLAAISSSWAL